MGIFGNEAERLLRESWTPNELAEELFAIFTSTNPLQISSPVEIVNNTTDPPLTITNLGGTNTQITLTARQPAVPTFPDIPPLPPLSPGPGSTTTVNIYQNGNGEWWQGDAGNPPTTTPGTGTQLIPPAGGGGGGMPGKVLSGTGATYQVQVWPKGFFGGPSQVVTVTQLQIDPTAQIPPGTWAIIAKAGEEYFMQCPVWLTSAP